ncbi:hypothetical protein U14_03197 [Candidatus Moduliflexus flocculans]|uniref:Glycosyltransferase RgtA/B/C/D-like domain-containing protein n=1 Tax=Candidatus Moduliflexus flocculans TaxID=1499966 RepID=A0A081BNI5_9BACT|nr:hypothetical protein U14_03197 [Candidatus Moduliflexus flocculans]
MRKIQMRNTRILKIVIILLILLTGITARFLASQRGYNADFVSWQTVAKIANSGGNVYAETRYYNYGPVWFHCLHLFAKISQVFPTHTDEIFRLLIVGLLTSADVGIFVVLYRQYSLLVAALFFLNPISIIITGYHNQFDNLAIFIGLCAVILIDDSNVSSFITKRKVLGLVLLGFSLMTKHLLFLFPLWVAVKQNNRIMKLLTLIIPVIIFLFAFLPYWHEGKVGILENVFYYQSYETQIFYTLFVPNILKFFITGKQIWFLGLILFAFVCRKKNLLDSLLCYTVFLFITSPSVANQYLAIAVPFTALHYKNICFFFYTLIGSCFLIIDPVGLHYFADWVLPFFKIPWVTYLAIMISLLTIGVSWELFSSYFQKIARYIREELNIQIA